MSAHPLQERRSCSHAQSRVMTSRGFLALISIAALAGGCRPDAPSAPTGLGFTDLSGKWTYTAEEISGGGLSCSISGLELTVRQIAGAGYFVGDSSGGILECTGGSERVVVSLQPLPIDSGYTFNEHVAFNIYNPDWRNSGTATPEKMSGTLILRNGTSVIEGKFDAVRSSR